MRPERGFALLTALWVVAAIAATVGLGAGAARLGERTTWNRVLLARGRWAAEACLAIATARRSEHRFADTATVALGRSTRCAWRVDDPTARLNVNTARPDALRRLFSQLEFSTDAVSELVQAVVVRRPFDDVGQLEALAAARYRSDRASELREVLTVDGAGRVNVNRAATQVLLALPGMTPAAVQAIAWRRSLGRPIADLDSLAAELSGPARAELLAHYAELAESVAFASSHLLLTVEGWSGSLGDAGALRAAVEVLVVPLPDRLAVLRRRVRA